MMYIHVWTKYLPVIKILLKKSQAANQTFDLNRIDFEKAGSGRKSGYKFSIDLKRGRVSNVISSSALATDLATVLTNDSAAREILANLDVTVSLNPKFQLLITNKEAEKARNEMSLQSEPSEQHQ